MEVIAIDSDEEELAPAAPARSFATASGADAAGAIELSDDDEPAPSASIVSDAFAPPPLVQTGDVSAPVVLGDDDEDFELQASKRARTAAAACKLCDAMRFSSAYKLSACGHSFCRSCVQAFVEKKLRRVLASEVTCPTCSVQLTIADVQTLSASSAGGSDSGGPAAMLQRRNGAPWDRLAFGPGGPSRGPPPMLHDTSALGARPVGSSVATRRLMRELQAIRKADCASQGFGVELPDGDNLYTWDAHFFGFESGTALANDLKRVPNRRIELRIAFPSNYPSAPPYVRVIRPRFHFRTGHVTIGGSICTEMLTSKGWSSAMTIESVLLGIRANMLIGGARLDVSRRDDYHEAEAREAFNRMVRDHGWY